LRRCSVETGPVSALFRRVCFHPIAAPAGRPPCSGNSGWPSASRLGITWIPNNEAWQILVPICDRLTEVFAARDLCAAKALLDRFRELATKFGKTAAGYQRTRSTRQIYHGSATPLVSDPTSATPKKGKRRVGSPGRKSTNRSAASVSGIARMLGMRSGSLRNHGSRNNKGAKTRQSADRSFGRIRVEQPGAKDPIPPYRPIRSHNRSKSP
jgi:hypothetical protein